MTDLQSIQARNTRVEADKAWETSCTRRSIIAVGTFIIIGLYLTYLGVENPWLHAWVPAMAYLLSTLSLHALKQIWIKKFYKLKEESS